MLLLREIQFRPPEPPPDRYPFDLPALEGLRQFVLDRPLTFFIGENGSGKSTLLESLAESAGLHPEGGSRNAAYAASHTNTELARALHLVWNRKPADGFFLRAESFFGYADYLDEMAREVGPEGTYAAYGGRSLHERSHGESFLALFRHRLAPTRPAFLLLDEPESALSIAGQLALLSFMHRWERSEIVQAIVATHSPILLAYPGAAIWTFDARPLARIAYEDTEPYRTTRAFLNDPDRFLHELFRDDP